MMIRCEEVEGIPSGILTCFINNKEVGVTKCSPTSITVCVPEEIDQVTILELATYCFTENQYHHTGIAIKNCVESVKEEFCWIYTYEIEDTAYAREIRNVQKEYMSYIRYKMEYEDSEVSQQMVGYPAVEDEILWQSYEEMEKDWMLKADWNGFFERNRDLFQMHQVEMAVCLDTHKKYRSYCRDGIQKLKETSLPDFLFAQLSRLYIGNQFCPNLFPQKEVLYQILGRAEKEGMLITLCLSYLRDDRIEEMQLLFSELAEWCRCRQMKIEIVCNDFGYFKMLETEKDVFCLVLGILLNKRRKDPRYPYKKGFAEIKNNFGENAWNSKVLTDLACSYGVDRYEYESCGYEQRISRGHHSMHLPLYQTNTAAFCTLHARCAHGDRGEQYLVKQCNYPCEKYVFSYPKHLKMLGKYNSLFAFDDSLWQHREWLECYLEQGIDRLVWNL